MIYAKLQLLSICFVTGFAPFPHLWWDIENYQEKTVFLRGERSAYAILLNGSTVTTDLSELRQGHFLYFNGSNAGFIFNTSLYRDKITSICFLKNNILCREFTFAFWVKWSKWGDTFVIASPSLRMQFLDASSLVIEFITENQQWGIFTFLKVSEKWDFYSITFNTTCLQLIVNAVDNQTSCQAYNASLTNSFTEDILAIGLPLKNDHDRDAEMYIDDIMIWNRALTIYEIESAFSFDFKDVKVQGGCSTTIHNKDRYLDGYVIQETKLNSIEECLSFCLENGYCQSFNFEYKGIEKKKKCVINSSRNHDAPWNLIKIDGYFYYDIE
ncbi:uncharacterized protein LOC105843488 isoform X1 [Hydra vulgaris]|uniref:uncharacterized protein LOC105843488 isoform X1 n=1 Tax=Hydra vulgaris TaxID=6087 RepID=UPI001F5F2303|nr:uncharacterized protein LOC105843488 [Hydra vulgaris]